MIQQRVVVSSKKKMIIPMFKYCNLAVAEEYMIREHSFRVGTFSSFREIETRGRAIKDEVENAKRIDLSSQRIIDASSPIANGPNPLISFGEGAKMIDPTGMITTVGNDCYLFSFTTSFEPSSLERWHQEEGYDCCVEIARPNQFVVAVGKRIQECLLVDHNIHECRFAVQPVTYDGRDLAVSEANERVQIDPFQKYREFAWQQETRLVIEPTKPICSLETKDVKIPKNAGEIRIVGRIDDGGKVVQC